MAIYKRGSRTKLVNVKEVKSEEDCEYFGDMPRCREEYACSKVFPCRKCTIKEECKEKQFEDMCYVKGTHGFSITCNRAYELEVIELMMNVDKHIKRKVKGIPGCKLCFGLMDSMEYVEYLDD
jgi:hypothetical protein